MGDIGVARELKDVTPHWLAGALRYGGAIGDDSSIVDLAVEHVGTGQMGDCLRITPRYHGPAGPSSLIVKLASTDETSRATGLTTRSYEIEVAFYRHLAPRMAIRTPRCYAASIDMSTGHFSLVLEDRCDSSQGDQLTGCSLDHAVLAVEQLAGLHASGWADPTLEEMDWLNRSTADQRVALAELVAAVYPGFVERYADRLTDDDRRLCDTYVDNLSRFLELRQPPFTVLHGDYRVDNMLFAAAGDDPLTVVDWQTATWGPPAHDLAYFCGTSLPIDVRRRHEDDLLRRYHEQLCRHGIVDYSWDQLLDDYRLHAFAGAQMAIIASMIVERTERGDDMFFAMLTRSTELARDHDAATRWQGTPA